MHVRSALVPASAMVAVAVMAAPALAHEEITPKTIPTGQPGFLALTAANESSSDLGKIVLRAPTNLRLGEATRSPAGWSATAGANTVTWTGGALRPGTFETFGFEVEGPDQPGTLTFTVMSTNAAGRTDEHEVEVTAAPETAGGPTPGTAATATSATTAPTSPTTAAAASDSDGDSDDDSDGASGTAKTALALSVVALVLAVGSLAVGARSRRGTGSPGAGSRTGAAQDW